MPTNAEKILFMCLGSLTALVVGWMIYFASELKPPDPHPLRKPASEPIPDFDPKAYYLSELNPSLNNSFASNHFAK